MSKASFLVVPADVLDETDPFNTSLLSLACAQGYADETQATYAVLEVLSVRRVVPLPPESCSTMQGPAHG